MTLQESFSFPSYVEVSRTPEVSPCLDSQHGYIFSASVRMSASKGQPNPYEFPLETRDSNRVCGGGYPENLSGV